MTDFKGWVPTITGKLSFSEIGNFNSKTGKRCCLTFKGNSNLLEVIAWQKRVSKDTPKIVRVLSPLTRNTKKLLFLYKAKEAGGFVPVPFDTTSSQQDFIMDSKAVLQGQVLVYGLPGLLQKKNKSVSRFIKSFKKNLKIAKNSPDVSHSLLTNIPHFEQAENGLSPSDLWAIAQVDLLRSGECKVRIKSHNKKSNQECDANTEIEQEISNQIFFFIRDLTHKHYHHAEEEDQTSVTYASVDDYTWRRETLYSLSRIAIQSRRKNSHADCKSALGLIAYARAFQKQFGSWCADAPYFDYSLKPVPRQGGIPEFVQYDFTSMQASLEATIKQLEWKNSLKVQKIALIITIFGIGSALLLGVIGLNPSDNNPEFLESFTGKVANHPLHLLGILVAFCLLAYFAILDRSKKMEGIRKFITALLGSLYSIIKWSIVTYWLSLPLLLVFVFVFLVVGFTVMTSGIS